MCGIRKIDFREETGPYMTDENGKNSPTLAPSFWEIQYAGGWIFCRGCGTPLMWESPSDACRMQEKGNNKRKVCNVPVAG